MRCKETNTPGKSSQRGEKNLETKKVLGEKVERNYAVKICTLSFRTLTSNQNSRDVTRCDSDLLRGAVFIPSATPVPTKGLAPDRCLVCTGWTKLLLHGGYKTCCWIQSEI